MTVTLGGCISPVKTREVETHQGVVERRILGASYVIVLITDGSPVARLRSKTIDLDQWVGKPVTLKAMSSYLPVKQDGSVIPWPDPRIGDAESRQVQEGVDSLSDWLKSNLDVLSIRGG